MKTGKRFGRKDTDTLKKDIADTASTAKEITQGAFRDGKEKTKRMAESVEEQLKTSVEKIKKAVAELSKKEK